jgi:amino acid adenylation domain-containing protein
MKPTALDTSQLSPERQALLTRLLKDRGVDMAPRTIPRRRTADRCAASFAQRRLWFLDQLAPGNPFYNLAVPIRLPMTLDVLALERTVSAIVERHEALRTTFDAVDGEPVQVIGAPQPVSIPVIDLRHLPPDVRERETARLAAESARLPFDLRRGPLLRTAVLRVDTNDYLFLVTMHHIISDGWSAAVFGRELQAIYPAMAFGYRAALPDLPVQYGDFAEWQREWLQGPVLETQLAYWRQQLFEAPVLALPTDRPRPPMSSFRGAVQTFRLSPDLLDALRALGQRARVTLFMTLLAGFQALLARYSGQPDIVVGAPIAGRSRPELEPLIGFFVNTLVLRTDLSGDPTTVELLARVRRVVLDAFAHVDVPFEKLVEELQPRRDLSRNPLCQVALQLLELPGNGSQGAPSPPIDKQTAVLDIVVTLTQGPHGMDGVVEYSTDLFDENTIARLLGHYEQLLRGMVTNPETSISALPLLPPAERDQILIEWNDTVRPFETDLTFHQLFERQAASTPDSIAVSFGKEQWSYATLNRRANQLAACLRARGVAPDVLVAIAMERSLDMVVAVLGTLKAGGAYVPLDVTYPRERLGFMLADSQAHVLLTHESLADRLPATDAETIFLDLNWDEVAACPDHDVPGRATSRNLAYVIYTSGSTGKPKGVMIEHRSLINATLEQARSIDGRADSRVLQFSSFSFDGWVYEMMMAFGVGAQLCLAPRESLMPGPELVELLREQAITTVLLPPSALAVLPDTDLPALRCLNVAGEPCPPELAARWAPGRKLFNVYGPTEVTCWCTQASFTERVPVVHIGRPMANAEIFILDPHGQPVPVGVPGELHVGGVGLARGYLRRPELTLERFIAHPFRTDPEARLYRTGDLAKYRADGTIEFLGRLDHQIKLRGYRIELGEVETVLGQHPAVREAVVVCREDQPGDRRLVAYVVADTERVPHAAPELVPQLRGGLQQRLPDYMVPAVIVLLDELPRTPSGKIDRAALPAPDSSRPASAAQYVGPRTPLEQAIADVWAELLGVKDIGVNDHFFGDLGGHSLLATQACSRMRDTFQVDIPLRSFFEAPTIAALARTVEEALLATIEEMSEDEVRQQSLETNSDSGGGAF